MMTRDRTLWHRALILFGCLFLAAGLGFWHFHETLDRPLAAALHTGAASGFLNGLVLVTRLGGAAAMIPLALLGVLILFVMQRRAAAFWLLCTVASGRIAVEVLKLAIGRTRPDEAGHLVEVASASFPSSHAAGTMLTMLALVQVFRPGHVVIAFCLSWAVLVGVSRIMLGVHWPSDVFAGWGVGMLWAGWAATGRVELEQQ